MNRKLSALALLAVSLVCVFFLAACSNSTPTLRYITISPATTTISATTTQQYTATGYYSNGSIAPNLSVTWASSNTSVATIDPVAGVATAVATGTTLITATTLGISATPATLNVNQLISIAITPLNQTILIGGTEPYDAMGTFQGPGNSTTTSDVTSMVTWNVGSSAIATFSTTTPGLATGVAGGTTTINATLDGVTSNTTNLTVSGTTLVITPSASTIAVGNSVSFTVVESNNGATNPPANPVTWTSSAPTTAGVIANGAAAALGAGFAAGTVTITATEASTPPVVGTITLTVVTGSTHYAYVANVNGSSIQSYTVTASTAPYLTALATTPLTQPTFTLINPNGQYLYEVDGNSNLWIYTVTPASGAIAQTTGITQGQAAGFAGSNYAAVDPYGRFVYVSDDGSNTSVYPSGSISGFTVNQTTGALTPISGVAPFTTGLSVPEDIIIDHTGSYLFAINYGATGGTTPGAVTAYSINQTTGALTPLSTGATIPTGDGPEFATWDPTGTYLYVANNVDNTVSGYSLGTGGVLTSLGTALAVPNAVSVLNVAVSPNGSYLYVLDGGNAGATPTVDGQVYGFTLTSGVPSTTPISGTPVAAGVGPTGIVIDPTSSLIAVDNSSLGAAGTISLFTIGSGGTLTSDAPVDTGLSPIFVTFYNAP
jgi:6-phosphogluconolactonase (cycloisomerase 2 family)